MFSYRTFKEYYSQPLKGEEIAFIKRTFANACGFFALFGFSLFLVFTFFNTALGGAGGAAFFSFVGFLLYFPLGYYSSKYRVDPMNMPEGKIGVLWTLFLSCFGCLFLGLSSLIYLAINGSSGSLDTWKMASFIFIVFGITSLLYAIPVGLAFMIKDKRKMLKLGGFLKKCAFCYIAVFIISLISSIWSGFLFTGGFLSAILSLLFLIMLFCSPIITIYRMKVTVPYINYDDEIERKKWERFFVFEVCFQLLQLAYHVARFVAQFFISRSSRL